MKNLTKIFGATAMAAVAVFATAACETTKPHTHVWEWKRTATEHWQVCSCGEERLLDTHENGVCDTCAEFKALAFGFTEGGDTAHADFAAEANVWFKQKGQELGFIYDSVDTGKNGWGALNEEAVEEYNLIVLLNDKPASEESRVVFRNYMENGGACVAFHAAGFAMWNPDPFTPPTEWEGWFNNTLLGCGVYGYCERDEIDRDNGDYYWNTWNPTSEPMKIETHDHIVTEDIEADEFVSAPCEWYEWSNNLFESSDTTVLVSMNPTPENPAGDDNRPELAHQIWKGGHHAIAWASNTYNLVYMNWGHNLQSYNLSTGSTSGQSSTFSSEIQNQITLNAMFGVTKQAKS